MVKPRTSKIWTLPEHEFMNLINTSRRMREVMNFFGFKHNGNNFTRVKERIDHLKLDVSHFLRKDESSSLTRSLTPERFKENYLTINFMGNNSHVKRGLIRFNMLKYECRECANVGTWRDQTLSLQLEHKNGDSSDNRLENLCYLCPNCHSQTDTYAGKKTRKSRL